MVEIAIIKLGEKGDVVRTLPILICLKEKYPNSEIYWITKKDCENIVKTSPYLKKVLTIPLDFKEIGDFDILYNFDIDKEATELAGKIKADKKYGFCREGDYSACFNLPAEYYLNTLFDDELKKTNKKSYQQMMFEVAELPYKKQHHPIFLTKENKKYAENFIKENSINTKKLIGIHLGASSRWPSKIWHEENIKEFIKRAKEEGYEILLFGGPNEIQKHKELSEQLIKQKIKIHRNNPQNSDIEFISLVNLCKYMVCSDSFSLHVSLALKKPTIGLFFCTPPNEIEDYGILKKLISPMLYDFFPEKMDQYSEELTKSITVDAVLDSIKEFQNDADNK